MTLTRPIYGDVGDPDLMDEYADAIETLQAQVTLLLAPPVARLRQTVAQSLTNNAWSPITFTTEDLDSDGGHSTSSNTSRYVFPRVGTWRVGGGVGFAVNATGQRAVRFAINGSALNGSETLQQATSATQGNRVAARSMLVVASSLTDYIEIEAFQNSGGALNTLVTSSDQSTLDIHFVR